MLRQNCKREVSHNTVSRNFEFIQAIWNFAARENGISDPNPFTKFIIDSAFVKGGPVQIDAGYILIRSIGSDRPLMVSLFTISER